MSSSGNSKAIHARLGHQVIDSDGHWREFEPIALKISQGHGRYEGR
jgi:hypothetical protein